MITLRQLHAVNVKSLRDVSVAFPAQGAILVEGPNESGKSTLFESIYFALYGAALVTEDNSRSLENLIAHGEESARVCLELDADGSGLTIHRTVRRGRPNQATLIVAPPTGESERITGVRAVNARIIDELGGLDGTALLNSCFVEQKRLSKLEELDARERRDSLLRILNLDELSRLEESYRVRTADTQHVTLTASRLELARTTRRIQEQRMLLEQLRRKAARRHSQQLAAAVEEAELGRDAAEEHLEALRQLVRLEQASGQIGHEVQTAELRVLREGPRRAVLAGTMGVLGLLLAALIAAGSGRLVLALVFGVAAVLMAVLAGQRFLVASRRAGEVESQLSGKSAEAEHARTSARRLRLELGLPPEADVEAEMEHATRTAGAADRAVSQARLEWHQERTEQDVSGELETEEEPGAPLAEIELPVMERTLHELEATSRYLSESLGVDPHSLDLGQCETEHAAATREVELKERSTVILAEARRRIVQRVLPETERNMKLILPMLTAGRYHDARVTEEYRVELWDEGAGRYVSKSVYSGGTKDQVSLALRLAFAIASLPRELGTSPGFLFMDEPLSSFDEERTRALIDLITRGELGEVFPQICIISHSKSFDAALFPYVIRMERGRIA